MPDNANFQNLLDCLPEVQRAVQDGVCHYCSNPIVAPKSFRKPRFREHLKQCTSYQELPAPRPLSKRYLAEKYNANVMSAIAEDLGV